jgi:hypothetical protein
VDFLLVDSREKKIKVVQEVAQAAGLKNVQWSVQRVEQLNVQVDFVVSRAVTSLDAFVPWVRKRIHCRSHNAWANGILYLRGGDFEAEIDLLDPPPTHWQATPLQTMFEGEFFESKYLVHLSFCRKAHVATAIDTVQVLAHMQAYARVLSQAPNIVGMDFAAEHGWVTYEAYEAAKAEVERAEAQARVHLAAIRQAQALDPSAFEAWLIAHGKAATAQQPGNQKLVLNTLSKFVHHQALDFSLAETFRLISGPQA